MRQSYLLFIALFGLFAISLTSCTIESETYFAKDMSGSQIVSINGDDMVSMLNGIGQGAEGDMDFFNRMNDPAFADTLKFMEDSMSRAFAGTGAENFSIGVSQDGVMSVGYDFKDIETFARMNERTIELQQKASGQADPMSGLMTGLVGGQFEQKGKWLLIPLAQENMLDDMKGNMPGFENGEMSDEDLKETMEMMEGLMGGSIGFKSVYKFEKSIKKVKSEVPCVKNGNSLEVEYTLGQMLDWVKDKKDTTIKVKLK